MLKTEALFAAKGALSLVGRGDLDLDFGLHITKRSSNKARSDTVWNRRDLIVILEAETVFFLEA